jgi:hypothetical protein
VGSASALARLVATPWRRVRERCERAIVAQADRPPRTGAEPGGAQWQAPGFDARFTLADFETGAHARDQA